MSHCLRFEGSIAKFMAISIGAFALVLTIGVGVSKAQSLRAETIDPPSSIRVFPGESAGAKATNSYCLMCHSAGMVLNQPLLKKEAWRGEVDKMVNAFKAPIPQDQLPIIVKYLYSIHGSKSGAETGAAS